MTHDRSQADARLDGEIALLLAVEPSPAFHAAVRARVAQRSDRLDLGPRWLLAIGAAGAAAVVSVSAGLFGSHSSPKPPEDSAVLEAVSIVPVAATFPVLESGRLPELRAAFAEGEKTGIPAGRRPSATSEIVIAPDEAAGLELLMALAGTGQLGELLAETNAVLEPAEGEPIHAIAISRIEIPPLEPDAPPEGVHQ